MLMEIEVLLGPAISSRRTKDSILHDCQVELEQGWRMAGARPIP